MSNMISNVFISDKVTKECYIYLSTRNKKQTHHNVVTFLNKVE